MPTPEEHMRAARGFAERRVDTLEIQLMRAFLNEAKFPSELKNFYFDLRESVRSGEYSPVAAFRNAYPNCYLRVCAGVMNKAKVCERLDHLEGKVGGEIVKAYERQVESNIDAVQASLPIVMILKLPYFSKMHVMHCLDPVENDLFGHEGKFWATKSAFGYWMILQPLEYFLTLPTVKSGIEEYFQSALAGER